MISKTIGFYAVATFLNLLPTYADIDRLTPLFFKNKIFGKFSNIVRIFGDIVDATSINEYSPILVDV